MSKAEMETLRAAARQLKDSQSRHRALALISAYETAFRLSRGPDPSRSAHWKQIAERRLRIIKSVLERKSA